MDFSLIFCEFLSMVVVGVLLLWICHGGDGFFFDFFFGIVAVVLVDFSLIFCVVTVLGLWALWWIEVVVDFMGFVPSGRGGIS